MSQTRETDGLSTATKPKAHIIKSDSRSADAFGQIDLAASNAGIPKVAPLMPGHKDRPAADCAMAMLAFAAGLLVTSIAARGSRRAGAVPADRRARRHGQRPRAAD